jgi:hypothetical protein
MRRKPALPLFAAGVLAALVLPPAAASAQGGLPSPAVIRIGAAYLAKQVCSCVLVAHRSEASCRPEFKAQQIGLAKLAIDRDGLPERATVRVSLLTTTAEAAYSRAYGCVLVK